MTNTDVLRFIDTHAHLDDDQFEEDREMVIARARAAHVSHMVNIGYCPARWQSTLQLADQHREISYTLGMHPQHAAEWTPATKTQLLDLLSVTRAVAIGEIGIDLYRDGADISVQRRVFDEQLDIAQQRNLPVVIHQRAAEREIMEVLRRRDRTLRCIFHSFEGSMELAAFGLERGFAFGVGGLMTRKKQETVRQIISEIPLEHILLETDSPYLVPAGVRGRRNEPANIPRIAERLANLRGIALEKIAEVTTNNAIALFGLSVDSETKNDRRVV